MKIHLRDMNPQVVNAWRVAFDGVDLEDLSIEISQGDILELSGDVIVSPANSYGWMTGGIDLAYRNRFGGVPFQTTLQDHLKYRFGGMLKVGSATTIPTTDEHILRMICAPTMINPGPVPDSANAYLAMRAAMREAIRQPLINSMLCPGLCTLTGRMHPEEAANQMADAVIGTWRRSQQ